MEIDKKGNYGCEHSGHVRISLPSCFPFLKRIISDCISVMARKSSDPTTSPSTGAVSASTSAFSPSASPSPLSDWSTTSSAAANLPSSSSFKTTRTGRRKMPHASAMSSLPRFFLEMKRSWLFPINKRRYRWNLSSSACEPTAVWRWALECRLVEIFSSSAVRMGERGGITALNSAIKPNFFYHFLPFPSYTVRSKAEPTKATNRFSSPC